MLTDLKKLFARTWDAFTAEASRREPEDQVAEILSAMRREMVDARATLPLLQENIAAAERELARERTALDDAVRRGGLAQKIGDAETVRVAAEFADRHRRRIAVLEEKVRAARAEHELRGLEVQDMMRRYKEADLNRFALLNEMRRAQSGQRLRQAGAATDDDFARATDRIESEAAYSDALDELSELDPAPPPQPSADDVEERLREMKRRMGM
jgi:phage shock protein A